MNPPTPGHLLLIENMILDAVKTGVNKIFIILSHSMDNDENPLHCSTKRDVLLYPSIEKLKQELMKQYPDKARQIQAVHVEINCMDDQDVMERELKVGILSSIKFILSRFYGWPGRSNLKLRLIIGDDRNYQFVGTTLSRYNPPVDFEQTQLNRSDMSKFKSMSEGELQILDIKTVPSEAMSASLLRRLVKYRLRDKFKEIMERAYTDPTQIEELWDELVNILPDESTRIPDESSTRGGKRKYTHKKRKSNKRKSRNQFKKRFKYLSSFIHI